MRITFNQCMSQASIVQEEEKSQDGHVEIFVKFAG